ncbi:putative quinol monooxygenase [Actinomadura physcomitrii]|uniref:putative quinol monooxygenase n=1 Tax=Actinomadura physcomitrii TaxID=2650748 RepID=UPI002E2629A3
MTEAGGFGEPPAGEAGGAARDLVEPGCELYLVNRQADAPDTVWVTELWRDQSALQAVLERIKGSPETAAAMKLVAAAEMIELAHQGGKGPVPAGERS